MSDFTGYNQSRIEDLGKEISGTISKEVANAIKDSINNEIITPLSQAWFTPEGQTYIKEFASVVDKSEVVIQEVFQSFLTGVQTAADNWAENVGSKKRANLKKAQRHDMKINHGLMKDNTNGNVGVINAEAEKVVSSIETVRSNISSQLKAISGKLNAESAFIGAGQAEAVKECFIKIHDEVAKIFKFLNEGENNLASSIKAAVTKYGDVGKSTATYFNSGQ